MANNKQALSKSSKASARLTRKEQDSILALVNGAQAMFPYSAIRAKLRLLDLAYYMESHEQDASDIYHALELPVVQPNVDASVAYLSSVFLTGHPLLGVVSSPSNMAAAQQLESVIEENSVNTGWARQLALFIRDGIKYNTHAIEVEWKTRQIYKPVTDHEGAGAGGESAKEAVLRAGNELKRISPYNSFYDMNVTPADMHTKGDYFGYTEKLSVIQLHRLISELKTNGGVVMNETLSMWKSSPTQVWFHKPEIVPDPTDGQKGTDWNMFFGTDPTVQGKTADYSGHYEVTTCSYRIIPEIVGISVPAAKHVQIWKFVIVNGQYLIHAERQTNAHDYLPVLMGQPNEDGLDYQTKGMGEQLLPVQNLSTKLYKARIASLQRSISDRGLYDPSRVSEANINSKIPSAKIPVRPSAYGKPVGDAYHQIPYDDRSGASLMQDIRQVQEYGSEIAHINKSQKGQFQKGNKTLEEYSDVMANADSTQQTLAIMIENQVMVPLKRIVKLNVLQYQQNTSNVNPTTGEPVEVDPTLLRKTALEFKIADGILPKDKIINGQTLEIAFQTMTQMPALNATYDVGGMFAYLMNTRGANLDQFKRAEPQAINPDGTPAAPQLPPPTEGQPS